MRYRLQYKVYSRKFSRPVRMGSTWMDHRDGILIRLTHESGDSGFGEIAPLESFGSEAVEKAELLLKSFHESIDSFAYGAIDDDEYPCTCYALERAIRQLKKASVADAPSDPLPTAKLLQNDALDLAGVSARQLSGVETIKIKIGDGVLDPYEEMQRIEQLVGWCLTRGKRIRLDANEQLDINTARDWLDFLSPHAEVIEFLEQPLDRCMLAELAELSQGSPVPIALDESVAVLRYQENFVGKDDFLYVVKPSLGDLPIVEALGIAEDRIILSSVFETAIGFAELLELPYRSRVGGFDTQSIFESDSLSYPMTEIGYLRRQIDPASMWSRLP